MRRLLRILRTVALLLVATAIVLAGLLAFNTVTNTSRQVAVAPLPPVPVDQDAAARRLAEATRWKTIASADDPDRSADAFRGLHAQIAAGFPAFHAAAKREVIADYSLLYTWEGSDPQAPPVALLAHQDVVPVAPGTEGDWEAPPFDGAIRDGYVWGRGSWDDKGNLFAMLEAADLLVASGFKPRRTIYLAFGADEEVGGLRGAKAMAALLAERKVQLDFVIDEGLLITEGVMPGLKPPAALIGVAEKGYMCAAKLASSSPPRSSMPPPPGLLPPAARSIIRRRTSRASAVSRSSPTRTAPRSCCSRGRRTKRRPLRRKGHPAMSAGTNCTRATVPLRSPSMPGCSAGRRTARSTWERSAPTSSLLPAARRSAAS